MLLPVKYLFFAQIAHLVLFLSPFQIFGAIEEPVSIGFPVGQNQNVDVRDFLKYIFYF